MPTSTTAAITTTTLLASLGGRHFFLGSATCVNCALEALLLALTYLLTYLHCVLRRPISYSLITVTYIIIFGIHTLLKIFKKTAHH